MSSNNESVVFQGLSSLIRNNVLGPICQHLATKGMNVTVDELANVLKLPANQSSPMLSSSIPSITTSAPPTLNGFPGLTSATQTAKRGRSTKAPVAPEDQCMYQITRGKNKGQRCPNQKVQGGYFCNGCSTKKAAQAQLQSMNLDPSAVPAPTGAPGSLPGLNAFPLSQNMSTTLSNPPLAKKFTVVAMGQGLYKISGSNLCLRQDGSDYICVGSVDENNNVSPLNADQIKWCKDSGISYVESDSKPSPTSIPPINTGALSNMNSGALPSLPGANSGVLPNMNSGVLPSLPTANSGAVPNMSSGVLPSLPGANAGSPAALPNMNSGALPVANSGVLPNMSSGVLPSLPTANSGALPNMSTGAPMNQPVVANAGGSGTNLPSVPGTTYSTDQGTPGEPVDDEDYDE